MERIETVRGPLDASALGVTLMHEHVFVLNTEVQRNYPGEWQDDVGVEDAAARLEELRGRGVDTIVDLTVLGLGRDLPLVQRVAERTSINIVAATGVYTYCDLPFWFRYRGAAAGSERPDVLVDLFVGDITDGIAGTGVKAGVLKCATDEPGLTRDVERVLRAVARAHRETGVLISTHTHAHTFRGRDQQRVFREEGVDLERVVIGHCGDTTDVDYLRELMDNGSTIGMDRFGIETTLSTEDRVATVARLCAEGYAARMVLSHDAACHIDWFDVATKEAVLPRWRFTHIPDEVLPALRAAGVTDAQLDQMLVENPRRLLPPRP